MLFTFLVVAVAPQAMGMRPSASASARSSQIAQLRDLALVAPDPSSDPLAGIQDVANIVNSIMLQEGNATEHLDERDKKTLNDVIEMLPRNMYASMTLAHKADDAAMDAAIKRIEACYEAFEAEVADGGDIKILEDSARAYQIELNILQDDVDVKTAANATAWSNLEKHMSLISDAPQCPGLPNPRTMVALDVYFVSSDYVTWWAAQKAAYEPIRDAYLEAHARLLEALRKYAVGLAVRNVAYCDWKKELEAGCARYSECYEREKAQYLNVDKPGAEKRMNMRIEAYKAGETIIHKIKFLLALVSDQAVPAISTDEYQMTFPNVPAKRECDMSALDDPSWVPTPVCQDECLPPVANEADAGYQNGVYGWYDVQGCGQCNDYCRWVGNGGAGPDPATGHLWFGQSWWSCRLAGTDKVYTGREHFTNKFADGWPYKKCSGKGASARLPMAQIGLYPGYDGSLQVSGLVMVMSDWPGTLMTWDLEGVDPLCANPGDHTAPNACGIHAHAGMTCEDADEVGGHYYKDHDKGDAAPPDPWKTTVYTAIDSQASGSASVATFADVVGRAVVVHDHTGGRIGCGILTAPER